MATQSPLSNLSDILGQVKDSAALYSPTLSGNEAATRAALIDPILRSLGWDTANADMVEVEKYSSLTQDRADYALHDNNDYIQVIVEAKSLGTNLDDPKIDKVLLNYAHAFRPQDVFLTDGLVWKHYRDFQATNFLPTRRIDIANGDLTDCAAYLVQWLDAAKHWPAQQTVDVLAQQVIQLQSDLATLQQRVQLLERTSGEGAVPNRTFPEPTASLVELENVPDLRNTKAKPTALRLPDGSVIPVGSWRDVLRESCKFALASNPDILVPHHDRAAGRRNLLDIIKPTVPGHTQEQYGGRTIFLYLNYNANDCIQNAVHILRQVPVATQKEKAAVEYN